MSFLQQPGKDMLVGLFLLQRGPSSARLQQDSTFARCFPEQRGWFSGGKEPVLEEKSSRRVGSDAEQEEIFQVTLLSSRLLASPLVWD